jgi:hypothetical protein
MGLVQKFLIFTCVLRQGLLSDKSKYRRAGILGTQHRMEGEGTRKIPKNRSTERISCDENK